MDTCGSTRWENLAELLEVTDLFLYDIKHMDESRHKELTGKGNREILNNLTQLKKAGASIWVRYPMIPGANDTAENLAAMAEWLRSRDITSLELLPYHRLGEEKAKALLQNAVSFSPPKKEQLENTIAFLKKQGICVYYFGT